LPNEDEDPFMQQEQPDIPVDRIIKVTDAKGREHECILLIRIVDLGADMSEANPNQCKHWAN
jgi:hypothetical protein